MTLADKQLPTRDAAKVVRPESIPTPEGKTEKREWRSANSKTFLHAEKSLDGKEIRTCQVQLGAVCYRDDNGELRSIDTTIRRLDSKAMGVEWAPYLMILHKFGIGFDFVRRDGGYVKITLSGVGGEKFDQTAELTPDIEDNVITFRDVRPGCDIVFKCLNDRVKTLRILHDDKAPRTFEWRFWSDKPEMIDSTLTGTDATGKALDLTATIDGDTITEAWAGGDVVYPVEIDPTVTVNPAANADDGTEQSAAWVDTIVRIGSAGGVAIHAGIRFPSVAIGAGVTVTSATLGLQATSIAGAGGVGTIYGRAADNPGQFGAGADLPSAVSKTTASTAVSAVGTTGAKSWDVTTIAAEVLGRGGWALNNAIAIPIIGSGSGTNHTTFANYESGSNIPSLAITYIDPGQPTMSRGNGIPGIRLGNQSFGRGW